MTQSIMELAQVVRSKNSGPYELVLDILFKDKQTYSAVKTSGQFTKDLIASLYKIDPRQVQNIVWFDPANAVKSLCQGISFQARSGTPMCMALSNTRHYSRLNSTSKV